LSSDATSVCITNTEAGRQKKDYEKEKAKGRRKKEGAGEKGELCARGNARQPVFRDEPDCDRFLKLLSESAERFEAAILCFVLMGNHFHLVAQTHRPNLRH
jgi:hypothetical protein